MMEEEKTQVPPQRRGYRHKEDCSCKLCAVIQSAQSFSAVRHSAGQLLPRRERFGVYAAFNISRPFTYQTEFSGVDVEHVFIL